MHTIDQEIHQEHRKTAKYNYSQWVTNGRNRDDGFKEFHMKGRWSDDPVTLKVGDRVETVALIQLTCYFIPKGAKGVVTSINDYVVSVTLDDCYQSIYKDLECANRMTCTDIDLIKLND